MGREGFHLNNTQARAYVPAGRTWVYPERPWNHGYDRSGRVVWQQRFGAGG